MRLLPILAVLGALLTGCAPATRVVLLPQDGGKTGAVEVSTPKNKTMLDRAYETAAIGSNAAIETEQLTAAEVDKRYGALLALQPKAPERFTLYFVPGGSQLTPESTAELRQVLARAAARPGGEIVITGHTDSVGPAPANDALSLRRAQAIRELVIKNGFEPARVDAVGRGEREPVVPTADEVDEPKNRRAEVTVR